MGKLGREDVSLTTQFSDATWETERKESQQLSILNSEHHKTHKKERRWQLTFRIDLWPLYALHGTHGVCTHTHKHVPEQTHTHEECKNELTINLRVPHKAITKYSKTIFRNADLLPIKLSNH